jgi:hypothetical protein
LSEMSYDDAIAELTAAASQADDGEQAVEAPTAPPASPPAPESGAPADNVTPEGQAPEAPAPVAPDTPDAPFNPDELPEELLPAWRQMQAAFTPRLQQAAAINKRFEELGGEDTVQQAVDLYTRISDPQSWPELYEELYRAMEASGFEFEDPTSSAPGGAVAPGLGQLPVDDPDLAPIIQQMEQLRSRSDEQQLLIDRFYAEQDIHRQMAEEELRQTQYLSNMQRQVVAIRQANPHYTDDDMRAVVELGSFYNDDLGLAQQRFEDIVASRLDRYFEAKKAGAPASVQPPTGAGVLSDEDKRPITLADAEAEAVELMRRLQAEGEIDF